MVARWGWGVGEVEGVSELTSGYTCGGAVGGGEGGERGWRGLAQGRVWWSTHVPPSLGVVTSRLKSVAAMVKIASSAD